MIHCYREGSCLHFFLSQCPFGTRDWSMNFTRRECPFSLDRAHMPCKNHIDEDDAMTDPDYAKFLKSAKAVTDCYISENVTVVRNYYELHFVKKVRGVESITYEVEELSSDMFKCKVPEVSKADSLGSNVKYRTVNEDEFEPTCSVMNGSQNRKRLLPDEEVDEEVITIHNVENAVNARYREGLGKGNCYRSKFPSGPINEPRPEREIRFKGSGPKSCRKSADCDRAGSLKTPSIGWGESEFGFMDHSYKTLLDVVELIGDSLVLKTNGGEVVEFEKQSSMDPLYRAGSGPCKRKNSMSHQQGKNNVTGLHHVLGRSSTKRRKVYGAGQNYRTKLRSNIINTGEALFPERKEKENTSQHIAHKTSGSVQELNLEVNRSSAPKSKGRNHISCATVEQDFKLFLDSAMLREGLLVYKMDDGEEIVLEEDSDSSSIIVTDNADALTDGKSNPFVITKHHYSLVCIFSQPSYYFLRTINLFNFESLFFALVNIFNDSQKNSKRNSDFRRMLIKTLRKPYDYREHKMLLRKASRRKPVVYHRELRSRAKDYPVVEVLGKSYFDHHRGLEDRFNSVRKDHRKGLNLLRGFFYWLKNLIQEGSFKPWTDKVCLQIMPRE